MAVPTCKTCAHAAFSRCNATGYYQGTTRKFDDAMSCGPRGRFWTPRPGLVNDLRSWLFGAKPPQTEER